MSASLFYPEARVVVFATFAGTKAVGGGPFGSDLAEPVVAFPALPTSCEVQRNSYNQADSWSIDFDHKDFPITPQSLKACGVEIYLYNRGSMDADLTSLAGTPAHPQLEPAISGLVDGVVVEYGEGGRVVTLEGQDYTALFTGRSWRADAAGRPEPIPSGKALDALLEELIGDVDVTRRIRLDVRLPEGTSLPVVGAATSRTIKSGFKTDSSASYWSVMSKVARVHGFILYVEGSRVVLTTPGNVHTRFDRLFRLEWGRNLSVLRMERQLGKERVPQIEVRAYDDRTRTTLVERFPAAKQEAATGIGTNRDERQVHVLYGVRDKKVLQQFARNLYELIARGEQEVEFETADLQDEQGLDLLSMRAGDAVAIDFDAVWDEVRNLDQPQIYSVLISRGYPPNVAQFLSQNYKRLETFKVPFYTREARLSWSVEQGLSITGRLINFVGESQPSGEIT